MRLTSFSAAGTLDVFSGVRLRDVEFYAAGVAAARTEHAADEGKVVELGKIRLGIAVEVELSLSGILAPLVMPVIYLVNGCMMSDWHAQAYGRRPDPCLSAGLSRTSNP